MLVGLGGEETVMVDTVGAGSAIAHEEMRRRTKLFGRCGERCIISFCASRVYTKVAAILKQHLLKG